MEETYYEILGIEPGSDLDEIKRAYRSLARKYHPDGNNPDASDLLFRRVSEAYSTLSSAERRERYDATLGIDQDGYTPDEKKKTRSYVFSPDVEDSHGRSQESQNHPGKTSGKTSGSLDPNRTSEKNSGRFSRRPDGKTSAGHESDSEQETILGKLTRAFTGTRNSGSGRRPSSKPSADSTEAETIDELDLRGDRIYQFSINGLESLTGTTRELALRTDEIPRMIRVKVPPGVSDGDVLRIRVATEGEELSVPIRITISPHEFVEREGRDIVLKMPITFGESLSGVELDIPTLTGPVRLRVPPLWDVRKRFRVRERGIHREGSDPGDLFVQLQVFSPDLEPPQVREIATALDASYSSHPRNKFPTKFR